MLEDVVAEKKYFVMREGGTFIWERDGPFTPADLVRQPGVTSESRVMEPGIGGFRKGSRLLRAYPDLVAVLPSDRRVQRAPKAAPKPLEKVSFESSIRLQTDEPSETILQAISAQFENAATSVRAASDGSLVIEGIEPSFGSVNNENTSRIELRTMNGGYLVVASTYYRPSFVFWILFLILLFTWVGWLIPLGFYLWQKQAVQKRIERIFARINDEFRSVPTSQPVPSQSATPSGSDKELAQLELLERLGDLLQRGVLTQEEFQAKKAQILGDLTAPMDTAQANAREPTDDEDTQ